MSPPPAKPFFATLDAMRGVAAVLVMLRHVTFFPDFGFQESYLAVDLFFLLSGVVIANAYEARLLDGMSLARFCRIRALRVFPLYWIGCALMLVALVPLHALKWGLQPNVWLPALLMVPRRLGDPPFPLNHPAWSLFFELLINLLYALLVRWLSWPRLLALTALFGAGLVYVLGDQGSLDFGWSQDTLWIAPWRVGFPFFLGVVLYRAHRRYGQALAARLAQRRLARNLLPWVLVAAAALILAAAPDSDNQAHFDLAAVALGFPFLIALALCVPGGGLGSGLARWLGLISYPLYMLHVPCSTLLRPLIADRAALPAALFAAGLLLLCWLMGAYVDAPLRRGLTQGARTGYAHYARMAAYVRRAAP